MWIGRKKTVEMTPLERAREADRLATKALCFSIVGVLINVLAYLDEIESFVRYALSYLH